MHIAVLDSVTVSIAALMMGIFSDMVFVSGVDVFTSCGKICDSDGTRRRSSKVSPSFILSFSIPDLHNLDHKSMFISL